MRGLIFFSKAPIDGLVKTRLSPHYSPKEANKIYTALLKDNYEMIKDIDSSHFLFYSKGKLSDFPKEYSTLKAYPQEGDNIFQKMENALIKLFNEGYGKVVLIGGDIPELTPSLINEGFNALNDHDFVVGGSIDGGYYLIGARKIEKGFLPIDGKVETLIKKITDEGYSVKKLRDLSDIDYPEDLRRVYFRGSPPTHLKNTLKSLFKISIIVPIYNEIKNIERLQENLSPLLDKAEIILVDGGSNDGTLDKIDKKFKLIHSEKGRAKQMNKGAEISTGDILLFLHSDSLLPKAPLEQIREVMRDHLTGCFGIKFNSKSLLMKICQIISNHRIIDRKVMFGDQGIFIERDLFFDIGMFPDIPIMEDYQLSLTLKERNIKIGICKEKILTDDRRYPKDPIGKLRVMWKMNRLRKQYRDGVNIEYIAREYKDIR